MKYEACECWAFAWASGRPRPYITTIISLRRKDLIQQVEDFMGEKWRRTYRRGGRAIKVTIQQKD